MTKITFTELLNEDSGSEYVLRKWRKRNLKQEFQRWYGETGEFGEIYPSQGLLTTPYDFLSVLGKTLLAENELQQTLYTRDYVLEIFNHPDRLAVLEMVGKAAFDAPGKIESKVMDYAVNSGLALAVSDLGAGVVYSGNGRVARRQLLARGPFIKLGKYARIPFASGAIPDMFGSAAAVATMMACHTLAMLPRNGAFNDVKRQVDLVKVVWTWLESEPMLMGRLDKNKLLKIWHRNLVGVIEPEMQSGLVRAEALFEAGVRTFRIYSPEPGSDALKLLVKLKEEFGEKIEVFVGQIVSVDQAKKLEEAGADGLYAGIGGGGRCITAVRSNSVVDWPSLVWNLRGEIKIPVLIEGGGSDHIGSTLLLGASGIGLSRKAAGGTIESPGGLLYWVDRDGKWFKPYGGEASARTKYIDKKMLAFGMPAFVEGETTKAYKSYIPFSKPTIAQNIYFLIEDLILSLVFRGVENIRDLQLIDPSPLRWVTDKGSKVAGTH